MTQETDDYPPMELFLSVSPYVLIPSLAILGGCIVLFWVKVHH